jgi:acetyl esterase
MSSLDPFFAARFAPIADVTWEAVFGGDPVAVDKARAWSQTASSYEDPPVEIEDLDVPGPHGPVPVRTYRPCGAEADLPGVMWLHGGAFMGGDLDMLEAHGASAELAVKLPATVVSVDYRLAPAFRYPVPLDDCVAVAEWMAAGPPGLRIDAARLAVGGASAGANLAIATALRLRDAGHPAVFRAALLAYPTLHIEMPAGSEEQQAAAAALPPLARFPAAAMRFIYEGYLGEAYLDPPPYGVPALADLHGLPPVAIANASHDDLRSSGEQFASSLADSGVLVDEWSEAGMAHGYLNNLGAVDGADRSIDRFVDFARRSGLGSRDGPPTSP